LPEGAVGCVVPMHKEVAAGTLHSILKQAKIDLENFEQNL
jgi:predicted RNA binding protein YcfA (HicA-like mRNA interferase family)